MKEHPYWWDTVQGFDRTATARPLPADRVDVVVIGAGYTGLSAARRLARSGASVLVIERGHVGFGASSRNGGQVLTGMRLDPAALVERYGESRAREVFDAANAAILHLEELVAEERIDCEYERTGHIQAAWKPSHFDAFRDEQALLARVFDHRVSLVPRAEQHAEIGSDRYHGLLVDEWSRALNPARLVHGLAAAAQRAGACIATGVTVERVARTNDRWQVVTSTGAVMAGDVLAATDAYSNGALPALQRRLVPFGSYIIATEPLSERTAAEVLPKRRMAFDSKHFLYYFRLTPDRRLLFGGRAEFTQPTSDSTRRAAGILQRGMLEIFPQLAGTRVEYAWGGRVACARDQLPHAVRLNGIYTAAGYCGHGIALATELGDLMARRISASDEQRPAHPLLDGDWPAIPLYRGTPWFLPAVGAYYRVKDWIA